MKSFFILSIFLLGFIIFTGCQNFRYYDPAKPHHGKNGFLNNYDRSPKASFWKWQWERWTSPSADEPAYEPSIIKVDKSVFKSSLRKNLTWVGHATVFLQIQGLNILMDPVFSERVSPLSFIGPKRLAELPLELNELPPIDVVMISHNHYDHMDLPTLKKLEIRSSGKTLFLVPLGNKSFLERAGISNVIEMDWWDNYSLQELTFTFTPTQHWSSRGLWDRDQTLWGGWFVAAQDFKFFFAGDTGYSKDFQDIYRKLGAVDVALIPIGAYAPKWFMKKHHVSPEEAVKIHKDLQAKLSVPIHWGTFRLSDEPLGEPPILLKSELVKANLSEGSFRVMKIGETLNLESLQLGQK